MNGAAGRPSAWTKFSHLLQHFGWEWLARRTVYEFRLRSGLVRRRMPAGDWKDWPLSGAVTDPALASTELYGAYRREQAPAFFFGPHDRVSYQDKLTDWDDAEHTPVRAVRALAQGQYEYFSRSTCQVGFPPDWHRSPFSQRRFARDRHWSVIDDFGEDDIKVIWEPSRFAVVFALVRAYWRDGDETHAEMFWRLVEDWREMNQPNLGANWKCGQEVSIRVMAWSFGLYGFLTSPSSTNQRIAMIGQMMVVSGRRIEANLNYALGQRNNHGISEATGLWTIGLLFPEFEEAQGWRETAKRLLEKLGEDLIGEDGAFTQHSVNYHRLMLQAYLWSLRLGDLLGQPLAQELKKRVCRAGELLYQLQDRTTGRVPGYGQNDGALILPLDNCSYEDFRPVVQAIHFLATGRRCFGAGMWDEDLLWLWGPSSLDTEVDAPPVADLRAAGGGYYTLRSQESFVFTRCTTYRSRPGQADMLHLDLWWRGENVACDAGTYSYNAPAPWNNPLAGTEYHNTVSVDNLDQMDRVGRFLWAPWTEGRVTCDASSELGLLTYFEGEHDGYRRLKSPALHRRGILRMPGEAWLVLDDLVSEEEHQYRCHWLLLDAPYDWDVVAGRLELMTAAGRYHVGMTSIPNRQTCSLARADPVTPRGWCASHYHDRIPALSLEMTVADAGARFLTGFGPAPMEMTLEPGLAHVKYGDWCAELILDEGSGHLVREVRVSGGDVDRLRIP
jgi:hypothetical protein